MFYPKHMLSELRHGGGRTFDPDDRTFSTALGPALKADRLTKRYGGRLAVDHVSLEVPRGTVAAFIGPNGAGKTTTIRLLLGLVTPTSGEAWVLGRSIAKPSAYLPRVGAMIEGPTFYPGLSGRANLEILATLGSQPKKRVDAVLERVGLAERAEDAFRSYSLGMKQRLGIAAALLPEPELLVLDEPTNGLDPAGILEIRALFAWLAESGTTVFVSSHLLAEVEQVANWLVLMKDGSIVFDGPIGEAMASVSKGLVLRTSGAPDGLLALVRGMGYRAHLEHDRVVVDASAAVAGDINRAAMDAGLVLVELTPRAASLEETFFSLTELEAVS